MIEYYKTADIGHNEVPVQVDLRSEADVEELQGVLGLALQLDQHERHAAPAANLQLPCQAAFTSMVPESMRLAHK